MKRFLQIVFLLFLMLFQAKAFAQVVSYQDEPLLTVLKQLEQNTPYRFLYREPLLAGISVSFSSDKENLFSILEEILLEYDIGISVDRERKQVLIYQRLKRVTVHSASINGFTVDAETGERLPYATITWIENGTRKGVTSNQSGAFSLQKDFQTDQIILTVSYVGYSRETVALNLEKYNDWPGLTVRLEPAPFSSAEIIVNGVTYFNPADTVFSGLMEIGNFSPLGEDNSVRALQTLPAVNINSALNDGINVRGSSVNGFKVLLDGMPVFNQSHLFGLLDSFNPDVLQNRGFFYDVTPAQFESPSGGTLALLTRTGSLREYSATVGASNAAYRATLQGPIEKGRSSFMISGRRAYMNRVDWFNNRDLIEYGLNIARPSSASDIDQSTLNDLLIQPGDYDADFYDLHAKLYFESRNGDRFQISGYLGQDQTEQLYERCFIRQSDNLCPIRFGNVNQNAFGLRELETQNKWGNRLASASYQFELGDAGFGESLIGFSDYNTSYYKEDFTYQREGQGRRDTFLRPYGIENTISEFKLKQSVDFSRPQIDIYTGITYFNYKLEYFEDSFRRLNFFDETNVSQVDLSAQLDLNHFDFLNLNIGSRLHYYSHGQYVRWSPGMKAHLFPAKAVSFSAGFSRNHQFLNQIGLSNINSADIWIATTENQPPTQSDLFSAGIYMKLSQNIYFRVEGFLKEIENMRLHESQTRFIPATIESDVPWYYQNQLSAQGLEFLFRQELGPLSFSQSYTLSSVEVENPRINNGAPFHPDWDRRHQLYSLVEIQLNENFQLNGSSTFSTGAPNQLFKILEATESPEAVEITERLGSYHRIDISLVYRTSSIGDGLEAKLFLYNVLDRKNEWYREFGVFVEEDPNAPVRDRFSIIGLPVSVYDLGIQPSFNVKLEF